MKRLLLLLCMIVPIIALQAQNIPVNGTVTDGKNTPLEGVSVVEKGTSNGTFTSPSGTFSLTVRSSQSTLVFSSTGFSNVERLASAGNLNIALQAKNNNMDSVVVVAYGTQKKSSLTAAISNIKGEAIATQPVANISNAITGRVPGVIAVQGSGEPGYDGSTIRIRGIGTTGTNQQPLVIVDGIPRNFTQLMPGSIESFSILKDAAAVAPYGMGGANGVILITTKRGKASPPVLNYNGYVGWQNPTRLTDFVNSYEYALMRNAANANEGAPPVYSDYHIQKFRDGSDPDGHPDHDVLDELINRNTLMTSHNLSIGGGSERLKYFAGIGYLSQQGMWGPSIYKRYNLVANIDAMATPTTKVSLSVNGRVEDRKGSAVNTNFIFYQAFRTPPTSPLTFSNGLWGSHIGRTAYGNIHHSGNSSVQGNVLLNQLSIEQQLPVKGLSIKAAVSYDFNPFNPTDPNSPSAAITSFGRTWSTPIPFYSVDTSVTPYQYSLAGNDGPAKPKYDVFYMQSQAFTYQGFVNYNRSFGSHDISALFVLESRNTKSSVFGAGRTNYSVSVPELNNGSSNSIDISNYGYSSEAKQKSMVYRLGYGFAGKYLFEASGRYDGNYYFAPGNRWGFFPSFAAGWRISEEAFMKNIAWVNNLKLRGSYGQSGALAGAPFQYLSSYTLYGNAAILNNIALQGLIENAEPNKNITWERAKKTNIGIEAALFNGYLNIEADYFYEKRDNMLYAPNAMVPSEYGVALSQVNSGVMSNRGFEIAAGTSKRFNKDLLISFSANFTFARNKLEEVFETASTFENPNRRITGRPLNTLFGYKALGYFQTSDDKNGNGIIEQDEYAVQQPFGVLHPGDLKYEDTDGDGIITPDDQVVIGNPATPEIIYGFSPSINFKDFDLTILFQGAANRNFQITASAAWPFVNGASATKENLDYWTPDNPNAKNPRITPTPTANNTQNSSWWIRNGSYLRLKTGELGYNLPARVAGRLKMQALRIYVSGQNLATWSPIKNFDPEVSVTNGEYYPQQKVVTVGLNVTF